MPEQPPHENSLTLVLPHSLTADLPQRDCGPLLPCDGIPAARGVLLSVALCLPLWVWVCWALARHS
jgi:hypothetical protein